MIDVQSAAIAAVVTLLVVGAGFWLWNRRSSRTGDADQREQTQEELRLESQDVDRRERVGFMGRARVQPTTTLLFFGSVVAMLLVVGVGVYQVAKSGSPQEMAYADQIKLGFISLALIGTGVWGKMRLDNKAGELNITYEGEKTNTSETVPYDRSLTQPTFDDSGNRESLLVPVFKKHRILGLFWTPKLVADEDRARDVDKNLPDDQVIYEIPLDQSTTWDQESARINVRAKDTDAVTHPKRRATYEFVPSDRKSDAEIQDIEDELEQLRATVQHQKRMNGALSEQIEQYREMVENMEHDSLDHLNDSLDIFSQIAAAMNMDDSRRSPKDQLEAATNGERAHVQNGNSPE